MEKGRADDSLKESGVALIIALVITLAVMMLVGGLTLLLTRGFRGANVINRQFSTAYDAANGGVEHATGIIITYWNYNKDVSRIAGLGIDLGNIDTVRNILDCVNRTDPILGNVKTADGRYDIDMRIQCLGIQPIPGMGMAFTFPPPRPIGGGGAVGMPTQYIFYSVIADTREIETGITGRTEAVYRISQR